MSYRRASPDDSLATRARWRLRDLIGHRPRRDAPVEGPLVVAGFFRTASGVGQSARACADALDEQGLAPVRVDLSEAFGQVDLDPQKTLSAMPKGPGVVILHANAPETERALFVLGLNRFRRWRVIGYWAYELNIAPASWITSARHLSELWTPSRFVATAFEGKVGARVRVVPHFVPIPRESGVAPSPRGGVTCLALGDGRSSFERKNLLGAVRVFREAASGVASCRLIVKTRKIKEFPQFSEALREAIGDDRRIETIDADLAIEAHHRLMESADILVSLHRAEGFGLSIAEAMARGMAVLATGWSGNLDFMSEDASLAAPYQLVPVNDPFGVYADVGEAARWAEPDEAASARLLRRLIDDAALRARLGARARTVIAARLASANVSAALA
jgi:glycosyltransferase involved in cell wall biosynthesis